MTELEAQTMTDLQAALDELAQSERGAVTARVLASAVGG